MKMLILSRSGALYSTQSLLRACYKRGHYARVVDYMQCDLIIDQHRLEVKYNGEALDSFDAVIPRIGNSMTMEGTAVVRQFEQMGVFTVALADSILKSRDKMMCYQLLASNGIAIPKTLLARFSNFNKDILLDNFELPMIIKLSESTHGLGVMLSESVQNAATTIETLYKLKQKVIVQEYIKESRGTDIRAFVVNGDVVASMMRSAATDDFRSNLHRGATAQKERLSNEEQLMVRKVCRILKLDVAGVDILRSHNGPKILEVNSSPGLEGIETVTGVDVAKKIIQYVERRVRNWKRR